MFAIYYSMVDFFIHGVDLLGGYDIYTSFQVFKELMSV